LATFILVHGSWHGGWCWERVAPLLSARGHRVLAPDLPGMGEDRTPLAEDVMEQWTAWGEALVRAQPEPVVLVGHSAGGGLVSAVAERAPDRVAQVIFIAGALLADGQSRHDVMFGSPEVFAALQMSDDGNAYSIDPVRAPGLLYNQVPLEVAARAVARLVKEPLQPAFSRLSLSADRFGRTPRAYIECTEDRTILLAQQREMMTNWPCERVVTLPSDHVPLYSMPERLAEILADLAQVYASE
jgi:pimeloyl-ACP methyl ester carboxylesterase